MEVVLKSVNKEDVKNGEFDVPESVTVIGQQAFRGLKSLKVVRIHSGVKEIEELAFWHCANLEEVHLEEGLEKLGYGVFSGCEKLASIKLPSTVREMNWVPFGSCESLKTVYVAKGGLVPDQGHLTGDMKIVTYDKESPVKKGDGRGGLGD